MEKNEIKSILLPISLKDYLLLDNVILKTAFIIGEIKYNFVKDNTQCQHNTTNDVLQLIGIKFTNKEIGLFQKNKSIVEIDISYVSIYKYFVLKEQMVNLKYKEQLNLFENEQRKD